jgi:hypothetical protein
LCIASDVASQVMSRTFVLPKLGIFEMQDLLFTEKSQHYMTGYNSINNFVTEGNSQMSLLLLETFFLCRCLPSHDTDATVIYIDAYPGDHIPYLSKMFPAVSFCLYDERFSRGGKVKPTDKIRIKGSHFDDSEVISINREFSGKTLLYISLLRDTNYGKNNSAEQNSEIIDCDMWKQLKWAQEMKPQWSLIRYRPKLETERPIYSPGAPNISKNLTNPSDPPEKQCLYYKYPPGFFLRNPMAKKNRLYMFLMTCAERTDGYRQTEVYYHDDVISLCRHHNEYVRRVMLYSHPFTDTYVGIYGTEVVERYVEKAKLKGNINPMRYICGNGWDHSAMFFIMSLYMKQTDPSLCQNIDELKERTTKKILDAFIGMEVAQDSDQTRTA